jgi:hypothetical protein
MDECGAVSRRDIGQFECFQRIENLCHMHAAAAGRREANNRAAAVRRDDGLTDTRPVVGEILLGENAAVGLHPFAHVFGKGASVKPIRAVRGDLSIGLRQVGLLERVRCPPGRAVVVEEHFGGGGKLRQTISLDGDVFGVCLADGEPVLRQRDAGLENGRQRLSAKPFQGEVVGGQRTWRGNGERPQLALVAVGFAVLQVHVLVGGGRGCFATVDRDQFAICRSDQNEAPTSDARHRAVDNSQRERRRDGRVDRISTIIENVSRHIGRQRMTGGDNVSVAGGRVGLRIRGRHQ